MQHSVYPLGCCKHITVSFAGDAHAKYQDYEGLYIMEKSKHIDDEKIWKKHRPQNTGPKLSLRSSAPHNVDVWGFQDDEEDELAASIFDARVVRSKPVSNVNGLQHCPADYKEWVYWDDVAWKNAPDVKILCVTETTSKYNHSHSKRYLFMNMLSFQ